MLPQVRRALPVSPPPAAAVPPVCEGLAAVLAPVPVVGGWLAGGPVGAAVGGAPADDTDGGAHPTVLETSLLEEPQPARAAQALMTAAARSCACHRIAGDPRPD